MTHAHESERDGLGLTVRKLETACRERDDAYAERVVLVGRIEALREQLGDRDQDIKIVTQQLQGAVGALRELHAAGMALVPHMPFIRADVTTRWDEAMGAADDLLGGQ